uniref:Uncharacterized protein n=1 Tax=Mycena chlorophos TaxID=658473 RepID=A0ABQ0LZM8_MYCCL|nr:predicted protein [Mycena chlorophos]
MARCPPASCVCCNIYRIWDSKFHFEELSWPFWLVLVFPRNHKRPRQQSRRSQTASSSFACFFANSSNKSPTPRPAKSGFTSSVLRKHSLPGLSPPSGMYFVRYGAMTSHPAVRPSTSATQRFTPLAVSSTMASRIDCSLVDPKGSEPHWAARPLAVSHAMRALNASIIVWKSESAYGRMVMLGLWLVLMVAEAEEDGLPTAVRARVFMRVIGPISDCEER